MAKGENMDGMIDVTGVDLVNLAKVAYDLSKPQGMGYMHYTPGPLAELIKRIKQ